MIRIRAEENAVMLWNSKCAQTAYVSGKELDCLNRWASSNDCGGFIKRLLGMGLIEDGMQQEVLSAVMASQSIIAPVRSFYAPESLHIELTSRCPLHCPQCYKGNSLPSDIPYHMLADVISQADELNVFQIALGGGEPLLYTELPKAVYEITRRGMSCSITTSGSGLNEKLLDNLIVSGLNHIQISLNGSSKEINDISRDGYDQAAEVLRLLMEKGLSYGVNWVARMDNIDDLPDMVAYVKAHGAHNMNILRYKPSMSEDYEGVRLTYEKSVLLAQYIKEIKGIAVKVDSAFSNLLCGINQQAGHFGGCGAGRRFLALDAEGYFRPCSHIDLKERSKSLADYWRASHHLRLFREIEDNISEPCSTCVYLSGCRGCRAIELAKQGNFFCGDKDCFSHHSKQVLF